MPNSNSVEADLDLEVRIINSFDAPNVSQQAWDDLLARSETNTIFQTREWLSSWCKVYCEKGELLLILVFQDNQLVGLAPLMRKSGRRAKSTIAFLGEGNADYCDFLLDGPRTPVLRQMLVTLAGLQPEWHELRLNNIPEQSFTARQLHQLCAETGLYAMRCGRIRCPTLVFGDPAAARQSIEKRQSLKRPLRHFQINGTIEFTELASPELATSRLPEFFDQHIVRWQGTRSPSLFMRERNREFYRELVTQLSPLNRLAFTEVSLNGKPLAFHFGFIYQRRYYWYKPSYDTLQSRHSPGNLLIRYLLLSAIDRQCLEFDFTIGDESFKRRYSNAIRHNLNLRVFPQRRTYALKRFGLLCRLLFKQLTRPRNS